ncbi:TOX high mobility group box family member 2-like [Rhinoraja longicauda]
MAGLERGENLAYDTTARHPMDSRTVMPHHRMPVIGHAQLAAQMGMNLGRGGMHAHGSPSPPGSKSATPSPSSSAHEEEADALAKMSGDKRGGVDVGKKTKAQKKKKKDPNEPQKPVSAYALFFRDTQAAIKGQNPSATFGDVSKIVASMWDGLGEEQKQGCPNHGDECWTIALRCELWPDVRMWTSGLDLSWADLQINWWTLQSVVVSRPILLFNESMIPYYMHCTHLGSALTWAVHSPWQSTHLGSALTWAVHSPGQCTHLGSALTLAVHSPGQCTHLGSALTWAVHSPGQYTHLGRYLPSPGHLSRLASLSRPGG